MVWDGLAGLVGMAAPDQQKTRPQRWAGGWAEACTPQTSSPKKNYLLVGV